MKTMKFLTYATFVLFLGFAVSSCSGDDGADGADGATGPAGTAGTNGTDGTDGNANVQTYVFNNPLWSTSNSYLRLSIGSLSTSVSNGDAILGYVNQAAITNIFSVPGTVITPSGNKQYGVSYASSNYDIISYDPDGGRTATADLPAMTWVKVIIIESTGTTDTDGNGRVASTQQAVYNELEAAGIEVNDYYAVCAYYGINPE